MSDIQVSLDQVLSALKECLQSIDVRCAIVNTGRFENLVTGIRISARSPAEVQARHAKLINDLGPGEAGVFKVLYGGLALSGLDGLFDDLREGTFTIGGSRIFFPNGFKSTDLRGPVDRNQHFVRPWREVLVPAFYSYLKFIQPSPYPDSLRADVRKGFGVRSVNEAVDAFLEVNYSGQEAVNFFIHVEMPARISTVSLTGSTIGAQFVALREFSGLRLCINRYDSSGVGLGCSKAKPPSLLALTRKITQSPLTPRQNSTQSRRQISLAAC